MDKKDNERKKRKQRKHQQKKKGEGLPSIVCRGSGFESRQGHRFMYRVSVVLSGRGLCDGPITHLEVPYRLLCVIVCDLETSRMRRHWPALGCCAREEKI
jgi:hypothetical protein